MKQFKPNSISMQALPHKDGWHYLDYRDGKHSSKYTEWKYFNFVQGDMAGYIIYYVLDPEHKTSLGAGRLVARFVHQGKFYGDIIRVPIENMEFDTHTASVRMGSAQLQEKNPYNYSLSGSIGKLSWNLEYAQDAPTFDAFSEVNTGAFSWEKMSWLIKMPRAKVTGQISLNDTTETINALGYSDANWGELLPFLSRYEWGQFNDDNISIVFGVLYKWGRIWRTYIYAFFDNQIIKFEKQNFKLFQRDWKIDEATTIKIPAKTEFEVANRSYRLRISSTPVVNDAITMRVSSLLPKTCVVEQVSSYQGTLERNGQIICRLSGFGFSEYSTKTWKNTPVVF